MKRDLLGLSREELATFARSLGESTYRGGQLFQWLYAKGAVDFASMTDLGKAVRKRLEEEATIDRPAVVARQEFRPTAPPSSCSAFRAVGRSSPS